MKGLLIFLCVISTIILFCMMGERNEKNMANYTCAFCTCVLAIATIVALKFV